MSLFGRTQPLASPDHYTHYTHSTCCRERGGREREGEEDDEYC